MGVGCDGVGVGIGLGVAVGPGVGIWNGVGEGVAAVGTGTKGVMVGVATLAVGDGSLVSEPSEHAASTAESTNIPNDTVMNFFIIPFLTNWLLLIKVYEHWF
ncbi:MAG: hypothetical protein EXR59_05125 [Dehalococcoidia bacterium]|nr:hypothetical protein [Dehalococcoidia bacterium]